MDLFLPSLYVCKELSIDYDTDAFKYKYNWRLHNNGKITSLGSIRSVDYQLQLAIL